MRPGRDRTRKSHRGDDGYFDSSTHAGGDLRITCCASNSALVRNKGHVSDCLLLGAAGGTGFLHVPIHLTGSAIAEWTITPEYTPTPGAVFAGNRFTLFGTVFVGSQGANCSTTSFQVNETRSIDQVVELVCPISFGAATKFDDRTDANSSLGYAANGSEADLLRATANLSLLGVQQPPTSRTASARCYPARRSAPRRASTTCTPCRSRVRAPRRSRHSGRSRCAAG